jgi:hypothetical protein
VPAADALPQPSSTIGGSIAVRNAAFSGVDVIVTTVREPVATKSSA